MKALGPGARIADRYVLETVIAKGGMGAVYRAIDERLGRTVAIKLLLTELAEDETSIARFEREASASARLNHPAIVQTFDFGKYEGVSYIVMEHVVGRTIANELDTKRKIEPLRACDIIEQALGGIAAAHEAGIVHRDLKPGNIMLIPTGTGREVVKILDFGIAQLKESAPYARLTKTGAVLGTPTFMSPEQARGETCDGRTDVYAMGVVLWCCLTGQKPFHAADVPTTLGKVLAEMPPRADQIDPSIPAPIAAAVERAMQKRPGARYPTAAAFAQALADARATASIPPTAVSVTLPKDARGADAAQTREMPMVDVGAPATRVAMPVASPVSPPALGAGEGPRRAGWHRWALGIVVVAVLVGVLIGALIVVGVLEIERERGGADMPSLPLPSLPGVGALPSSAPATPSAPMLPTPPPPTPPQGGAPSGETCTRLHGCCDAYRTRVRPTFPDCDSFVGQLQGDEAICADRIQMFQRMFGDETGEVPPECL